MNDKKTNPATLQFFSVFQKDKPVLVLPKVFNLNQMSNEELTNLTIGIALEGTIKIPKSPSPWSEISEDSDHSFLMLQSRDDWGAQFDETSNLFEVESIRHLVEAMAESINNFSFRKDLAHGKFYHANKLTKKIVPEVSKKIATPKPTPIESKNNGGVDAGENW